MDLQTSQTLAAWAQVVLLASTAYLAWLIGKKQNEINERALRINDYIGVVLNPNINNTTQIQNGFNIQNVGVYPVYLESYTVADTETSWGETMLPPRQDVFYTIPLSASMGCQIGDFTITIKFNDGAGKRYQTINIIQKFNQFLAVKSSSKPQKIHLA